MQLLRKNNFRLEDKAWKAFEETKAAMEKLPTPDMPKFDQPFEIETYASGFGTRSCSHTARLTLAFVSQPFFEKSRVKSIYERELITVVFGVQKWRQYLLGHHFIIRTDQKSLKFLFVVGTELYMESNRNGFPNCWTMTLDPI